MPQSGFEPAIQAFELFKIYAQCTADADSHKKHFEVTCTPEWRITVSIRSSLLDS